ncbi:MAG: hypothetical protein AAF226_17740, partial [Verrucomicrobiota bacterium]
MKSTFISQLCLGIAGLLLASAASAHDHKGNWIQWRGPLQTGVSLESYEGSGKMKEEPVWTDDILGRGTPVFYNGRMYSWGYRGKGPDLEEVLQA